MAQNEDGTNPSAPRKDHILMNRTSANSRFGFGTFSRLFGNLTDLPKYVRNISDIGIDFSTIGRTQKIGIPRSESEDDVLYGSLLKDKNAEITDPTVPYFKKDYRNKLEFLRVFSTHPEIEFIVESIADDLIVYDQNGYFCNMVLQGYAGDSNKKVNDLVNDSFKRIYTLLQFHDGITVWSYAYQWVVEGTLVFEKLFDDKENPTKVVGLMELAPDTVIPMIIDDEMEVDDKDNPGTTKKITKRRKVWKQVSRKKDGHADERIIPDEAIIYITYNKIPGAKNRISYLERLVRSFNLMRTMENTTVAWHVMNAQFRMKLVIPIGSKTTAKAKQALTSVTNRYKEDLLIDSYSGEVSINGQSIINYGKSIVLPSRQGQTPSIESFNYQGPDLSKMDSVKHFERKLWRDSKMPYSRFDRENHRGNRILFGGEGIPYDEQSWYKLINRFRKEFQKIIVDAVYTDCILREKALKIDSEFKARLGIVYESNSMFDLAKEREIEKFKVDRYKSLSELTDVDGQTPLYGKKFLLVNKVGLMTDSEYTENKTTRDEELKAYNIKIGGDNTENKPDNTTDKPDDTSAVA